MKKKKKTIFSYIIFKRCWNRNAKVVFDVGSKMA